MLPEYVSEEMFGGGGWWGEVKGIHRDGLDQGGLPGVWVIRVKRFVTCPFLLKVALCTSNHV